MKTPREILLERNQGRSFQLDEIRGRVIAQELGESQPSVLNVLRSWLSVNRIAWSSFATVWVAIIGLNVASEKMGGSNVASRMEIESSDVRVRWQDYRAELAVLLFDESSPGKTSSDNRDDLPGPRSSVPGMRRFSQLRSINYV